MDKIFKQSLLTAIVASALDFAFHYFFTNPMETMTYFVVKFLLAFFVACWFFSSRRFTASPGGKKTFFIVLTSLIFSTLMSAYYRAWELGEAGVPFGSRAPDIIGITRYTILFSAVWWLVHASFFAVGAAISSKIKK